MKTIKKVTALILSTVLLFSFVTTNVLAVEIHNIYFIKCIRSEGSVSANFHVDGSVIGSYAEAGGSINGTSTWFVNARTYVENYHPEGSVWHTLYTTAAYVNLSVYCEHETKTTRENYKKCDLDDSLVYAWVRDRSTSDGCLYDFVTEHRLLEGIIYYEPDDTNNYYQFADSETIHFYTEDNYPNN